MFSIREGLIIETIGKKTMTVEQIVEKLFKGEKRPFDANISIGNSIRRIIEKCDYYKYDWTLKREKSGNKFLIRKENKK
jgi:hypothetical protein